MRAEQVIMTSALIIIFIIMYYYLYYNVSLCCYHLCLKHFIILAACEEASAVIMIVKVKNPVMSLNLMKIKCDLVSIIEDEINIKTSLLNILNVEFVSLNIFQL